jgi:hypothetical protein
MNKFGTPTLHSISSLHRDERGDWIGLAVFRLVPLAPEAQEVLPFVEKSLWLKISGANFGAALLTAGARVVAVEDWIDGEDLPLPLAT